MRANKSGDTNFLRASSAGRSSSVCLWSEWIKFNLDLKYLLSLRWRENQKEEVFSFELSAFSNGIFRLLFSNYKFQL
jgi:hypothetical protein